MLRDRRLHNWALAIICWAITVPTFALPVEDLQVYPTALYLTRADSDDAEEAATLRESTGRNTYLTSAAVAPWDPQRVLVATTFHGIFESTDGGRSWTNLGEAGRLDDLYMGNGFYEDFSAAAYDTEDPRVIWVELAQSGRTVALSPTGSVLSNLEPAQGRASLSAARRTTFPPPPDLDAARRSRRALAANHRSFYLSAKQASPEHLPGHLEFARRYGFTAIVVDFKNAQGHVPYQSRITELGSVGAIDPEFDAAELVQAVHDAGLYLIGRVVVFKDLALYEYDDNRYALWDSRRDAPWGVFRDGIQVEHWVDPFNEWVWDYNIAIAEELQALGVDEIQFDYIRTPAEGRVWDISYRYKADSPAMVGQDTFTDDRVEALAMFLERARSRLSVPIGIDVFGFNGWYHMSFLGQDIAALSRHVDVISPMLYPSHFPRTFMGSLPYLDWARFIYQEGTARSRRITGDAVIIRPYVQAFLLGGERDFDEAYYTEYLRRQIQGALGAGASGFTLWNSSGNYYMVSRGIGLGG